MTLGTRLTLWQASLLASLLAAFAFVSSPPREASLNAEMDRALRERADHVALAVQTVPNLSISEITPGFAAEFASPGMYAQIFDRNGRIVSRSANLGLGTLPVHAIRIAEALAGWSFYDTIALGGQNAR